MKPSLREVLANSHVAAVAIAVLLFWFMSSMFEVLWPWMERVLKFLITTVAILDIPYLSPTLTVLNRSMLIILSFYLYQAIISLSAAWLLSQWIYGTGPLQALSTYHSQLSGKNNA